MQTKQKMPYNIRMNMKKTHAHRASRRDEDDLASGVVVAKKRKKQKAELTMKQREERTGHAKPDFNNVKDGVLWLNKDGSSRGSGKRGGKRGRGRGGKR